MQQMFLKQIKLALGRPGFCHEKYQGDVVLVANGLPQGLSLRLVTKSGEGEEDKGGVFTAATLRLEQEGDVCPVRHLERPSVPIIDRARVVSN